MEEDVKTVKCPNCGFENAFGTKECYKCKKNLGVEYRVCPRCAKKNEKNTQVCTSCGFKFNKKRPGILFNLIFSVLLVVALIVCVKLNKIKAFNHISLGFRIVAVFVIISILYFTFSHGKKDTLSFDAEEEMTKKNAGLNKMKAISIIAVVVGVIFVAAFIIIKFILKK